MQRNKRLLKVRKAKSRKKKQAAVRAQIAEGKARREAHHKITDVRCSAISKSGKRCLRDAEQQVGGKWVCWQHGKKTKKKTK